MQSAPGGKGMLGPSGLHLIKMKIILTLVLWWRKVSEVNLPAPKYCILIFHFGINTGIYILPDLHISSRLLVLLLVHCIHKQQTLRVSYRIYSVGICCFWRWENAPVRCSGESGIHRSWQMVVALDITWCYLVAKDEWLLRSRKISVTYLFIECDGRLGECWRVCCSQFASFHLGTPSFHQILLFI